MISAGVEVSPGEVASHYDELDRFYREIWGEHVHHGLWLTGRETSAEAVLNLTRLVARELAVQAGQRVCDIGCGYGGTSRFLAREHGATVVGWTLSQVQAEKARGFSAPAEAIEYRVEDWLTADLPRGGFDAALAIESTEHMADRALFFRQAAKALRAEGRLVVCAWLAGDRPTRWQRRCLLEPICREGRMPSLGSREDYLRHAGEAGWRLERFQDVSRQVSRTWTAIAGRLISRLVRDPKYFGYLLDQQARHRIFARTVVRILLAYRMGAMRYGVFTFRLAG